MERGAWTDERLGDRFDRIDQDLSLIRQDLRDQRVEAREFRAETREGFRAVRSEIGGQVGGLRGETLTGFAELRGETLTGFAELRGEIDRLRLTMLRFGSAIAVVLVASVLSQRL